MISEEHPLDEIGKQLTLTMLIVKFTSKGGSSLTLKFKLFKQQPLGHRRTKTLLPTRTAFEADCVSIRVAILIS